MNLWVRTLRQLTVLAVALFFFSCEDEASLLGFKNPNKKFHVGYVDIPLNVSSVVAIDSVITDLRPFLDKDRRTVTVDGLLIGQYEDPAMGKISAQSFLTIYPLVNSELQSGAVYDSVTVQFRLNSYGYGFSGTQQKTFRIHEITGDTLTLFNGNTYYANSPAPQYSAEPIGQATVSVNYDSLLKQATLPINRQDTLLATGRLSDDFGSRLFEAIRAGFPSSALQKIFKYQIKGLALLPGDEQGMVGITVISSPEQLSLSRVTLHYHTVDAAGAVADTLSRGFGTDFATFTRIEADRSATELAGIPSYQSVVPPTDLRYIQSGASVITKVDLAPFYSFADTVENIVINSAEFLIEDVAVANGMAPHASLTFRLMKNNIDQFLNNDVPEDRDLASRYYAVPGLEVITLLPYGEDYYNASGDASNLGLITYDEEKNHFSGFLTIFVQSLFVNKDGVDGDRDTRLKYLGLYPVIPPNPRSVSRTIFDKDNLRLRIFYTRANPVTP